MEYKKLDNETRLHFIWRIYNYQKETGKLSNEQCGELCRRELNESYDESAYRKTAQSFEKMWEEVKHEYLLSADEEMVSRLAKIEEREDELYKTKVKTADKLREYRGVLRQSARVENLMDMIDGAVSNLPRFEIPHRNIEFTGNKTAILKLSDFHIGKTVDNFFNKYNKDIAVARVDKLISETVKYCNVMGVKTLYVANLGDQIEGVLRAVSRVESEEDIVSQIMFASELISKILAEFVSYGYDVKYLSTLDNHSRSNMDYKQHIEIESFARMIDWYIASRLGNSIEIIKSPIDPNVGYVQIEGKNHFFVHGHLKAHAVNSVIQNISLPLGIKVDYVHMAHWHKADVREFQFAKLYINGCLSGTDDYAFNNGWFSKPSQKLLIIDEDTELDININLQ